MRVIEIPYPETLPAVLNVSPEDYERAAKMALTVKLLE
jgi:hypothetical protein